MHRKAMIFFLCCSVFAFAAEDLYGVVQGGTIHQFSPAPQADGRMIYFSNGLRIDVAAGEPVLPADLTVAASEYHVVHVRGPVAPEHVEGIEATGARVYSYVSNYAFIVWGNNEVMEQVRALPYVDWTGIYQPAYKVSSQKEFSDLQGRGKIRILLYNDADLDPVLALLGSLGGKVTDIAATEWDQLINVEIDLERVADLARVEQISWIEPWHQNVIQNSNVQWVVQTAVNGNRRIWSMGIRGNGELVSTCDTGIRTSHYAFRSTSSTWITTWGDYPSDRKIIAYKPANSYGPGYADFGDESGNYYHGTHTAGTVTGDDTLNGTSGHDGVAIKSRIYFCDGGGSNGAVYLYPNLTDLFNLPYNGNAAGSCKLMSNSWGSSVGGAYDAQSAQVDQYMWSHPDFLLFFSNGNDGPGTNTVGSPATAKNCVSVGSTANGTSFQSLSSFSSRGPCDDGRRKPTILTPGAAVNSAYGGNDNTYWSMDGTSMAAPGAMGSGALVRQYFTDGWYPSGTATPADTFSPTAALIKAVLVCGADNTITGYTVPDNNAGWGRVDLDSVLYFSGDTRRLAVVENETGLSTGQYVEYTFNVTAATPAFRVALVWTDYPGTAGTGIKLVNNLNLTVTDPSATQYRGNVYSGGQSTTGGVYDSLNVEECVRRNSPGVGTWTVRVDGANCPYGPQPFALVVTGALGTVSEPSIVYDSNVIDDASGNNNGRVDPGETVNIAVTLRNDGSVDATNTNGILRESSTYITLDDSTAFYGTITANGGTAAGTFTFTADAGTPSGTVVPFTVYVTADGGYTTNCNFQIVVGLPRADYVTHNVGNCQLTVTKQGSIGYLDVNSGGVGFMYPFAGANGLYHSSFAMANASNYVMDRFYVNTGANPNNTDWRCTTAPDGRCWIDTIAPAVSDQESWGHFADSGYSAPKGLIVTQHGYAWDDAGYDDFVIIRNEIYNAGSSTVSNLYHGVIADFDMVTADQNRVGTDSARRLAYMWYAANPNPYIGVKLLDPTVATNVSAVQNPVYVYNGATNVWHDTTLWKFLNGTLSFASGATNDDWSVVVSAEPYVLAPGATMIAAYAFVGGSNLATIQENADSAQSIYEQSFTDIAEYGAGGPEDRDFLAPYPNPFKTATCLAFNLTQPGHVGVKVYDVTGQLVSTVFAGPAKAGLTSIVWDGKDARGANLPNGVYFYSIETEARTHTGKLIIMK